MIPSLGDAVKSWSALVVVFGISACSTGIREVQPVRYDAIRSLAGDDVGLLGVALKGTFRVGF